MQYFRGSPALSTFRIEKLLNQLKSSISGITSLQAEFVHFANIQGDLSTEQSITLEKLLTYGPAYEPQDQKVSYFW